MWHYGILANQPIYYGLLASLAVYVVVSLATPPTDAAVLAAWRERLAGRGEPPGGGSGPPQPVRRLRPEPSGWIWPSPPMSSIADGLRLPAELTDVLNRRTELDVAGPAGFGRTGLIRPHGLNVAARADKPARLTPYETCTNPETERHT